MPNYGTSQAVLQAQSDMYDYRRYMTNVPQRQYGRNNSSSLDERSYEQQFATYDANRMRKLTGGKLLTSLDIGSSLTPVLAQTLKTVIPSISSAIGGSLGPYIQALGKAPISARKMSEHQELKAYKRELGMAGTLGELGIASSMAGRSLVTANLMKTMLLGGGGAVSPLPTLLGGLSSPLGMGLVGAQMLGGMVSRHKLKRITATRKSGSDVERKNSLSQSLEGQFNALVSMNQLSPADQLKIRLAMWSESHLSLLPLIYSELDFQGQQKDKSTFAAENEVDKIMYGDTSQNVLARSVTNITDKLTLFTAKFDPFTQVANFLLGGKSPQRMIEDLQGGQDTRNYREQLREESKFRGISVQETRLLGMDVSGAVSKLSTYEQKMFMSNLLQVQLTQMAVKELHTMRKGMGIDQSAFFRGVDYDSGVFGKMVEGVKGAFLSIPGLNAIFNVASGVLKLPTKIRDITVGITGFARRSLFGQRFLDLQDDEFADKDLGLKRTLDERAKDFVVHGLPVAIDDVRVGIYNQLEIQENTFNVLQKMYNLEARRLGLVDEYKFIETRKAEKEARVLDPVTGTLVSQDDFEKLIKTRMDMKQFARESAFRSSAAGKISFGIDLIKGVSKTVGDAFRGDLVGGFTDFTKTVQSRLGTDEDRMETMANIMNDVSAVVGDIQNSWAIQTNDQKELNKQQMRLDARRNAITESFFDIQSERDQQSLENFDKKVNLLIRESAVGLKTLIGMGAGLSLGGLPGLAIGAGYGSIKTRQEGIGSRRLQKSFDIQSKAWQKAMDKGEFLTPENISELLKTSSIPKELLGTTRPNIIVLPGGKKTSDTPTLVGEAGPEIKIGNEIFGTDATRSLMNLIGADDYDQFADMLNLKAAAEGTPGARIAGLRVQQLDRTSKNKSNIFKTLLSGGKNIFNLFTGGSDIKIMDKVLPLLLGVGGAASLLTGHVGLASILLGGGLGRTFHLKHKEDISKLKRSFEAEEDKRFKQDPSYKKQVWEDFRNNQLSKRTGFDRITEKLGIAGTLAGSVLGVGALGKLLPFLMSHTGLPGLFGATSGLLGSGIGSILGGPLMPLIGGMGGLFLLMKKREREREYQKFENVMGKDFNSLSYEDKLIRLSNELYDVELLKHKNKTLFQKIGGLNILKAAGLGLVSGTALGPLAGLFGAGSALLAGYKRGLPSKQDILGNLIQGVQLDENNNPIKLTNGIPESEVVNRRDYTNKELLNQFNVATKLHSELLAQKVQNDKNLPKLAEGAIVARPTRAIIGEAGPEGVFPLKTFGILMAKAVASGMHRFSDELKKKKEGLRTFIGDVGTEVKHEFEVGKEKVKEQLGILGESFSWTVGTLLGGLIGGPIGAAVVGSTSSVIGTALSKKLAGKAVDKGSQKKFGQKLVGILNKDIFGGKIKKSMADGGELKSGSALVGEGPEIVTAIPGGGVHVTGISETSKFTKSSGGILLPVDPVLTKLGEIHSVLLDIREVLSNKTIKIQMPSIKLGSFSKSNTKKEKTESQLFGNISKTARLIGSYTGSSIISILKKSKDVGTSIGSSLGLALIKSKEFLGPMIKSSAITITDMSNSLVSNFSKFFTKQSKIFWNGMTKITPKVMGYLISGSKRFSNMLIKGSSELYTNLKSASILLGEKISSISGTLYNNIKDISSIAWDNIVSASGKFSDIMMRSGSTLTSGISTLYSDLKQGVTKMYGDITGFIRKLNPVDAIKRWGAGISEWWGNTKTQITDVITFKSLRTKIKSLMSNKYDEEEKLIKAEDISDEKDFWKQNIYQLKLIYTRLNRLPKSTLGKLIPNMGTFFSKPSIDHGMTGQLKDVEQAKQRNEDLSLQNRIVEHLENIDKDLDLEDTKTITTKDVSSNKGIIGSLISGIGSLFGSIGSVLMSGANLAWTGISGAVVAMFKSGAVKSFLGTVGKAAMNPAVIGAALIIGGGIKLFQDFMAGFNDKDSGGIVQGIARALVGSKEGGFGSAASGALKWAGIGFVAGSFVPVIGNITGALIGAAMGSIMGFLGQDRMLEVAKFLHKWGTGYVLADWFGWEEGTFARKLAGYGSIGVPWLGPLTGGLIGSAIDGAISMFKTDEDGNYKINDMIKKYILGGALIDYIWPDSNSFANKFGNNAKYVAGPVGALAGGLIGSVIDKVTTMFGYTPKSSNDEGFGAKLFEYVQGKVSGILSGVPLVGKFLSNFINPNEKGSKKDSTKPPTKSQSNLPQEMMGSNNTQQFPNTKQTYANTMINSAMSFYNSANTTESSDDGRLLWPTTSDIITSPYGLRNVGRPGPSRNHKGIDIRAKQGSPVLAANSGIVKFVGGDYGSVVIDHGGNSETRYMHLSSFNVKSGDNVEKGQVIGKSGNKGPFKMAPHLHFETRHKGIPVDPEMVYNASGKFSPSYATDIDPSRQLSAKLSHTKLDLSKPEGLETGGWMSDIKDEYKSLTIPTNTQNDKIETVKIKQEAKKESTPQIIPLVQPSMIQQTPTNYDSVTSTKLDPDLDKIISNIFKSSKSSLEISLQDFAFGSDVVHKFY